MMEHGHLNESLMGREEGFIIGDGVVQNADGSYSPNTTKVEVPAYYSEYYRRANVEANLFDATWVKLREISFGYKLPSSILSKTPFRSASLSLVGRNLWTIHKNTPNIDPESAYNTSNAQGLELNGYPMTRNVGFNLNLKF